MIRQPVIWALVYISVANAFFFFYYDEEEYYYTKGVTTTYEVYEQDEIDAQYIVNEVLEKKAFASVLPYRSKIRCMTIIREVGTKTGAGVDYITDDYVPRKENTDPFMDLVYSMTKDENLVLGGFLEYFFDQKDETWIIMAMVLCKDIQQMISTYDDYHAPNTFKELRKKQRSPFENMLRVWVRQNREPSGKDDPDPTQVSQDVNQLRWECDKSGGCWTETRAQIENILIKKSVKYAKAVIDEYEKQVNKKLEEVIAGCMNTDKLHDIGDAYASLAKYIKNKHHYISDIIFANSEGVNKWTVWSMCIAATAPKEWSKVNEIFQKNHGQPLTKFIMDKMSDDKVMAEMIAVIVDPKFQPTIFVKLELTPGASPDSINDTTQPSSTTTETPNPTP